MSRRGKLTFAGGALCMLSVCVLTACAPLVVSVCPNYLPTGAMIRDEGMFYDGLNARNMTKLQDAYYVKRHHIKRIERIQSATVDKDGYLPHRTMATSRIAKDGYTYINRMLTDSAPEMRVAEYWVDDAPVSTPKEMKRLMRLRRAEIDSVGVDRKKRIVSISTKKK